MRFAFFDDARITESGVAKRVRALSQYQGEIEAIIKKQTATKPEYTLAAAQDPELQAQLDAVKPVAKKLKHVVLVGIGGSSLGVEAVHAALTTGAAKPTLHVLDTAAVSKLKEVLDTLATVRKAEQIAICLISKSGTTAETVTNAAVLLGALEKQFGAAIYRQVYCVTNPGTDLAKRYKRRGAQCFEMPPAVGGRYSVTTAVGLLPLTLLGHDVDAFIAGLTDANATQYEEITAAAAARLVLYSHYKYVHYNFFAFETRLERLGAWYRQLFAESLGKTAPSKETVSCMLPTISTPVELHSVGQLFLSGLAGVYTDFVTFDDLTLDYQVTKAALAPGYESFTVQEVATAIYAGVLGAYKEASLPYRSVIFTDDIAYSLGLFMGMRMREVMYVAKLQDKNAFNQPNVEAYKKITRQILALPQ